MSIRDQITRIFFEPLFFKGDERTRQKCITFSAIAFLYTLFISPLLIDVISNGDQTHLSKFFIVCYALHLASYIISRAGRYLIGTALLTIGILFGVYSSAYFFNPKLEVLVSAAPFSFVALLIVANIASWQLILGVSILNFGLFIGAANHIEGFDRGVATSFQTAFLVYGVIATATSYFRTSFRARLERRRLMSIYHSRLNSLSEMSGGIAHEINNPLTIIQGYASQLSSLVTRQGLTDDKVVHAAQKIIETSERISRIIYKLRSFARDGEGEPFRDHSVAAIIENALDFCRARFRNHNVKISTNEIAPNLVIYCRPVQMVQSLFNLLNNAFDAVQNYPEKWVHIEVKDLGKNIEILVMDSGEGIDSSIANKIFDPFFTTKDVGQASGLGLSISNSLIASHGGKLSLGTKHKNTCFIVSLPKTQELAPPAPAKAA